MNKRNQIEDAIKQLLIICKEHNVSITGALNDDELELCVFEQIISLSDTKEGFQNISTLVKQKGDIGNFLCELSKTENANKKSNFFESKHDDDAVQFGRSNMQVYKTIH